MGEESGPGRQIGGEDDELARDAVLIEPVEGEVAQAGVFGVADAVLAAGSREHSEA